MYEKLKSDLQVNCPIEFHDEFAVNKIGGKNVSQRSKKCCYRCRY